MQKSGKCPVCGERFDLTATGHLPVHRAGGTRPAKGSCPGAGAVPLSPPPPKPKPETAELSPKDPAAGSEQERQSGQAQEPNP